MMIQVLIRKITHCLNLGIIIISSILITINNNIETMLRTDADIITISRIKCF